MDGARPKTPAHTGLQCLAAVARHHGVDLSVERMVHDFALGDEEPGVERLIDIARKSGLEARRATLSWEQLAGLGEAYPVLAQVNNGNTVILLGMRPDAAAGEMRVGVVDPLARGPARPLERAVFEEQWTGEVVLLKRRHRATDEDQPFGLRWFLPELRRQSGLLRDVALAALAMHVLGLATPIFVQNVLDRVLTHQAYATLQVLTIGIVIALLFDAAFSYLRRYLLLFAAQKIDMRLAGRTFERLLSLPIGFFERTSAGVLVKHMQQAERIREFLTGRVMLTILDFSALLVYVPLLYYYSPVLLLVVLAFSTMIGACFALLLGPFRRHLRDLYEAEATRQALLTETIHGMPTVKALAIEPRRLRRWEEASAAAISRHFNVGRISAASQAFSGLLDKLMTVAIVALGSYLVFGNELSVGALVAFQMLASRVAAPLVQAVALIHEYQETLLSVRMLGVVMNEQPEGLRAGRGLRQPIRGDIEFDSVTFNYPGVPAPALNAVNFSIRAGSVFGVVGRSGSGKSTLTRLVRGMYSAQAGSVRIDGHDVREHDLAHLRVSIGVVLQDNFLFRGTVQENIGITRPDATFEQIVAAAQDAGADEFVRELPKGYETMLEENGANLSGGQRQRLAIARALLPNPRVLILDEATSALDPESEALIQQNLARIAHGRTVIMVSHRLSSLVHADRIVVLDHGRIEGLGRHQELLQQCAIYRRLWDQQNRHRQ